MSLAPIFKFEVEGPLVSIQRRVEVNTDVTKMAFFFWNCHKKKAEISSH